MSPIQGTHTILEGCARDTTYSVYLAFIKSQHITNIYLTYGSLLDFLDLNKTDINTKKLLSTH